MGARIICRKDPEIMINYGMFIAVFLNCGVDVRLDLLGRRNCVMRLNTQKKETTDRPNDTLIWFSILMITINIYLYLLIILHDSPEYLIKNVVRTYYKYVACY